MKTTTTQNCPPTDVGRGVFVGDADAAGGANALLAVAILLSPCHISTKSDDVIKSAGSSELMACKS